MNRNRSRSSIATEQGDSVPVLLPGVRFCPTEEELVDYYLKKKIQGKDSEFSHMIPEIDVCKHEPCDLPAFFEEPDFPNREMEWFFFTRPEYKYINSARFRCNRATNHGFYKITGKEREIKARRSKAVIGKKRTLAFYEGFVPKHKKTNWVMHEYYLTKNDTQTAPNSDQHRDFVLCRLKNLSANYKKLEDGNYDECTESPNGSCLIDNVNDDIFICDDESPNGCSRLQCARSTYLALEKCFASQNHNGITQFRNELFRTSGGDSSIADSLDRVVDTGANSQITNGLGNLSLSREYHGNDSVGVVLGGTELEDKKDSFMEQE